MSQDLSFMKSKLYWNLKKKKKQWFNAYKNKLLEEKFFETVYFIINKL